MGDVLQVDNIRLSAQATTKDQAIQEAGQLLIKQGYVNETYLEKMFERETTTSTYMGNLLAIPHGTEEGKQEVKRSGLVILTYDQPIDWDGHEVRLVIGIAGNGNEHLDLLSNIAIVCSELDNVKQVLQAKSAHEVFASFSQVNV